jgi:hypothetical protein
VVGDALSDYDVGWVNLAHDGLDAATTALASLKRMADLAPRLILPSHGPIPTDPATAFAAALRRAQRLVDDPDGAIWYGVRRIFAFALMIREGIPADEVAGCSASSPNSPRISSMYHYSRARPSWNMYASRGRGPDPWAPLPSTTKRPHWPCSQCRSPMHTAHSSAARTPDRYATVVIT